MAAAGDDVVAGRDEGLSGGEVPPAPRGCVAGETEHCPPGRTDEQAADDQPDPDRPSGEQADEKADEQAEPGPAGRASRCRPGCGEPPGHPLDQAQTGADNIEVFYREALVGEPVNRRLRLLVGGVAGHGVPGHAYRVEARRIEVSHGLLLTARPVELPGAAAVGAGTPGECPGWASTRAVTSLVIFRSP